MRGVGPKLKARGARQRSDAPPADDLDDIFAPDPQPGDDTEFEQALGSEVGPDAETPHRNAPPSSLRLRRALRRAGATRLLQDGTLPAGAHEALEPPPLPQLEYKPATRKKPAKTKAKRRSDWRIGMLAAAAGIVWGSGLAYLAYSYLTGNTPLTLTTAAPAPVPLPTESTVAKTTETVVTENSAPEESEPLPLPVSPPGPEGSTEAGQAPSQENAAIGTEPAEETEAAAEPLPLPPPPPPAPAASPSVAETQSTVPQTPEIISPPTVAAQAAPQQVAAVPVEPPEETAAETKNQEVALQSPSLGERTSANTILDCAGCPKLVQLPAGEFQMGSQSNEADHQPDEGPQHTVRFAKPFAISAYEVTFDEWDACVKDGGCSQSPSDEGWGRGRNPVINVSWEDVTTQYLPWLSKKTGHAYRLPTEAEWEYAARATAAGDSPSTFNFGNDGSTLCTYGNGADATLQQANGGGEGLSCSDGHAQTAAVGAFKPNAFGLYDTHGNVWEWVEDCWNDSYDGAAEDGSARTTGDCSTRVLRGGSWNSDLANLRTAARGWNRSAGRKDSIGFRVVRDD